MAWIADNAATIIVLLAVLTAVFFIVRSWVKNKGLGCDGCSSECSHCKGDCPSVSFELTEEQKERLAKM
ncbi:MAG: FeoB-associated Cys-rich membrane protein [Coriobacteriales bacterium]|nr:FeoB-associated Cys-rich membrane protein [Coriobacteriales bacterium]